MKNILYSFSFVLNCLGGFVLCLPYTWDLKGTECCLVLSPLPLSIEPWHSEERVGGLEESGGRAWFSRAGVTCTWRRELLRAHLVALSCLFHHPTSRPKGAAVRTQKRPSSPETKIGEAALSFKLGLGSWLSRTLGPASHVRIYPLEA